MNSADSDTQANRFTAVLSHAVSNARALGLTELADALEKLGTDFSHQAAQEAQINRNARRRQQFFYPVE